MIIKLYKFLKWAFLLFILLSVVTTLITLIFNDFKPNALYLGKKRPPIDRSIPSMIDEALAPYLTMHPNSTGLYLLDNNLEAYADRILLVKSAERTLDLQYYIWHNDLTGNLLGYELLKAADRGVFIRILLDDLNAVQKDSVLSGLAQHPHIEIRLFNPIHSRRNFITRSVEMLFRSLSLNRRMHNKLMIADDQLAIIGGRNIGNEYFDADPETNFVDVDLLIMGQAVGEAIDIFEEFWDSQASIPAKQVNFKHSQDLTKLRAQPLNYNETEKILLAHYKEAIAQYFDLEVLLKKNSVFIWTDQAKIYSDPPTKVFGDEEHRWLMTDVLLETWRKAQDSLYLISAYFVPGEEGTRALEALSQSNVDITILTNSLAANDVPMVHAGYAPYRERLVKGGIRVYELMPFKVGYKLSKEHKLGAKGASLHTKAFIVDDKIGFIGSFNLDPRSARLNTEMGVLFNSPEMIEQLLKTYQGVWTQDNSYELHYRDQLIWLDGSDPNEIKEWQRDPETGWMKRLFVQLVSWLPIESQL